MRVCLLWTVVVAAGLGACQCQRPLTQSDSGVVDSGHPDAGALSRCHVDFERFRASDDVRGFASLRPVLSPSDFIGGPAAQARVGDFRIDNDVIRVIVQGFSRSIGAQPYGGTLLDADLARDGGAGQDQFGEMGLLYSVGRTMEPKAFEVLFDGSDGRGVVLAVTGVDTANDYLSIRNQLRNMLGRVPVSDPYAPLSLRITHYFIMNPHEQRVRFLSALCNESPTQTVNVPVGDLMDPGDVVEMFNPQSCVGGFGAGGLCFGIDRMSWFGYLGQGVAYGYAPYQVNGVAVPETGNVMMTVSGVSGTLIGAPGLTGFLAWFDPSQGSREGEMRIAPGGFGTLFRDFVVGRDLGEVSALIGQWRKRTSEPALGTLSGTLSSGGSPVPQGRLAVWNNEGLVTVLSAQEDGTAATRLPPGSYQLSGWSPAHEPGPKVTVTVPGTFAVDLPAPRKLVVQVTEVGAGPMPAKVTVVCASGVCPNPASSALVPYAATLMDHIPDDVRATAYAGAAGRVELRLPPARYRLFVSRGPEYSLYPPNDSARLGQLIDLRTSDLSLDVKLARVIDSAGFVSIDSHVHAVASPDSIVSNRDRVLSFAGSGVDVIISTDHDSVTDFAPVIAALGLSGAITSIVGEEISPMDWGHYNAFPFPRDDSDVLTHGAVDWAGGTGPTLSPRLTFEALRAKGVSTIQFNHPRGYLGGLSHLRADTDTFATHVVPEDFRMARPADATEADSKLLSTDFNAMEVLNSSEDDLDPESPTARGRINDWFVLLSRGLRIAAVGTTDTHTHALASGWRTFVDVGSDTLTGLSPMRVSSRLNAQAAIVSSGPFVKFTVSRVNDAGTQVTVPVGVGETVPFDATKADLLVSLDLQVPDYLDVTRVELYQHLAQDDASCPIDPFSARAATTRVACNGATNDNWPSSGIFRTQAVSLGAGDLKVVSTDGAATFRRYQKTVTFRIPQPATDNWLVAMVYGTKTLFPIAFAAPETGGTKPGVPFALTNPIYVDANGGGFDKPPFVPTAKATQGLRSGPPPKERPFPSKEEFLKAWGPFFHAR